MNAEIREQAATPSSRAGHRGIQVPDDPQLLEMMFADMNNGPDIFKPTNYWAVYENRFLPELRTQGLHDFRRRRHSILDAFGAVDLPMRREINLCRSKLVCNRITRRVPGWLSFVDSINALLNRTLPFDEGISPDDATRLAVERARAMGLPHGARSLEQLDASLAGNPLDVIHVEGHAYTTSLLGYYVQYAYCCQFVDVDRLAVVVELGCGAGKQAEVLKKLHPHLALVLIDIPPQLYVGHQYLRTVFPDDCVSYQDSRAYDSLRPEPGRIYFLGAWQFPLLDQIEIDLFWNSASFQEMEPEIVLHYLRTVNERARYVFLREGMDGWKVTQRRGRLGVLSPTTLAHYTQGLSKFRRVDLRRSETPLGQSPDFSDSFWERDVGSGADRECRG